MCDVLFSGIFGTFYHGQGIYFDPWWFYSLDGYMCFLIFFVPFTFCTEIVLQQIQKLVCQFCWEGLLTVELSQGFAVWQSCQLEYGVEELQLKFCFAACACRDQQQVFKRPSLYAPIKLFCPYPPRAPPGTSPFVVVARGSYHLNFYLPCPM